MNKNKALISHLFNHFSMHPARIIIMLEMILACIKVGSIQQHKIAQGTKIPVKTGSITRRIQRFLAQQFLCPMAASRLIYGFFTWEEKIILTLDRTNWKFGCIDINFLMICGIYKNYSIPLCWIMLPHQGNSKTNHRIDLIEMLSLVVPLSRIQYLLADREFIGFEWLKYLYTNNIPFCIRMRENMLIQDTRRGGTIKLKNLFFCLAYGQIREVKQIITGLPLDIIATRTNTGELLILAVFSDETVLDALQLYSCRWTIETMFKFFKTSGFNFEDTHQKNWERLYKQMILLAIAYAWAIKIGEIKNRIKPIKIKNYKRPEFSLFTYGFRVIQTLLLKGADLLDELLSLITDIALNKQVSDALAKITVVY